MLEVDVFRNEAGISQKRETVELDEFLVLTALSVFAVLAYTWRRAAEHQRETRAASRRRRRFSALPCRIRSLACPTVASSTRP
jgi:hypothetical protein